MENSEKVLKGRNTRVFQTPTRTTVGTVIYSGLPAPARHSSDPPLSCTPPSLPPPPTSFLQKQESCDAVFIWQSTPLPFSLAPRLHRPHHGPPNSFLHYLQTLSASQNPYWGSQGGSHSAPEEEKKGTQFTPQGLKDTTESIFSQMAWGP